MSPLSPLLWTFLPSQLTSILLPYLSQYLPVLFPPAPPSSPIYKRNYKVVFTLVITGWFIWTFVGDDIMSLGQGGVPGQGGREAEDDWYAMLGVGRGVDEDGLKRAFRHLSRTYHPDRAGSGYEERFIGLRKGYEGLLDPVKRYAYDRFGPEILDWKAKSVREYIHTGLMRSVGFSIASGGFMLLLALLGRAQAGSYYRNLLFLLLLTTELHLLLSPTQPVSSWFTRKPQFIQIRTLHRVFTNLSIGISQLGGVWGGGATEKEEGVAEGMSRVLGVLRGVELKAVGAFQQEVVPLLSSSPNPRIFEETLLQEMEQALVDKAISTHPLIRESWLKATRRLSTSQYSGITKTDLDLARLIPLPPSPPPSPAFRMAELPG